MALQLDTAKPSDVEQLLSLYIIVYGKNYPYRICTDQQAMCSGIASPDILWLVMRDNDKIVGSALFEMDRLNKIGKLTGVVVHPSQRKGGVAYQMIAHGCDELLVNSDTLNSIYATTRTVSVGPQLMCMKAGFQAFGIFPNAHRLNHYETTTLLIRFREDVLAKRQKVEAVLAPIMPILRIANEAIGDNQVVETVDRVEFPPGGEPLEFEIIDAPQYVRRLFDQQFSDPYDRFFPFHTPNIVAISTNAEVSIYAHINKHDGYCAVVSMSTPVYELHGRVDALLNSLSHLGISYIEVLMGLNRSKSIQTLLDKQFLPSAIYPAMCMVEGGAMQDFVVLSRTMEPLNFRGMAIERQFKPYVDQYVNLWKFAHLDSLEVFDDYR